MIFQRVTVGQLLQCLDNARGKITAPVAVVRCLYRDEFELYGTRLFKQVRVCLLILVTFYMNVTV
jgi:hypothetical protein